MLLAGAGGAGRCRPLLAALLVLLCASVSFAAPGGPPGDDDFPGGPPVGQGGGGSPRAGGSGERRGGGSGERRGAGNGAGSNSAASSGEGSGSQTKAADSNKRLEITTDAQGVSIFSVAADAHELFTLLGEKTGLKIIIDDTVTRKITVRLSHRKPAEIVDNIVAAYGLACADVNGIYMISEGIPRNPSSYLLSDIDSIRTRYVLATTAKALLPAFLQDHVKVNYEQNAVVLSAPTEVLKKFREDVSQFDIPAAQIMFDVLMVEFTHTEGREFALDVLEQARHHSLDVAPALGTATLRTVIGQLPLDFNVHLRALVQKGEARVRANPRIATVSGKAAEIFIGKERYISNPVDTPRGQINFIDAGVDLQMTPMTGGEGEVITTLSAEVSTMSAPDPSTGLPDRSTRKADTVIRVRDGETVIIGGMVQRERTAKTNKFPGLGNLPLLGRLFSSSNSQSTETELLIFVTPRILSQTGHLPEEEERQIRQRILPDEGGSATTPTLPGAAAR